MNRKKKYKRELQEMTGTRSLQNYLTMGMNELRAPVAKDTCHIFESAYHTPLVSLKDSLSEEEVTVIYCHEDASTSR